MCVCEINNMGLKSKAGNVQGENGFDKQPIIVDATDAPTQKVHEEAQKPNNCRTYIHQHLKTG